MGLDGLWLQADGCCSRASWAGVEVTAVGNVSLTPGWQEFARTRSLSGRCTLHFKYDGFATLYVMVFGEDGRCAGCCPEDGSSGDELGLGDGRDDHEGELALRDGRTTPSSGGSSSSESTSSGGYDEPPRHRAQIEEGDRSSRRRASVKWEESLD